MHTGNDVSKSLKTELKQALLSGISFAVPLIVAGGTVLAVAVLLAQMLGLQHLFEQENSWLWMYRKLRRGDVRHVNGAGTGRVYRLLAGR